jgi:hypothetical protein
VEDSRVLYPHVALLEDVVHRRTRGHLGLLLRDNAVEVAVEEEAVVVVTIEAVVFHLVRPWDNLDGSVLDGRVHESKLHPDRTRAAVRDVLRRRILEQRLVVVEVRATICVKHTRRSE